jgi:hypothetical protein
VCAKYKNSHVFGRDCVPNMKKSCFRSVCELNTKKFVFRSVCESNIKSINFVSTSAENESRSVFSVISFSEWSRFNHFVPSEV